MIEKYTQDALIKEGFTQTEQDILYDFADVSDYLFSKEKPTEMHANFEEEHYVNGDTITYNIKVTFKYDNGIKNIEKLKEWICNLFPGEVQYFNFEPRYIFKGSDTGISGTQEGLVLPEVQELIYYFQIILVEGVKDKKDGSKQKENN